MDELNPARIKINMRVRPRAYTIN